MELGSLHLLLTYQCTLECEHCFAWGSPWQGGTMSLQTVRHILNEARDVGTVKRIYFEGGEPFLYYATMLRGIIEANAMGFEVGIVTNSYWATTVEDAVEWLRPVAGLIQDLSVSSDIYHWNERLSQQAQNARAAAEQLGIPLGFLSIAQPEDADAAGKHPEGGSIMYRGRAAEKLVERATLHPWEGFTTCPYENLRDPGRVHPDPLGFLHICQGISVGNLRQTSLRDICATYDPDAHPIVGPLLVGGPVELVRRYGVPHKGAYADACHLCYEARKAMRAQGARLPDALAPDQMYGVFSG
jgi:MoaA/NifB/PqqE/SkfB family radical SAM enzyme